MGRVQQSNSGAAGQTANTSDLRPPTSDSRLAAIVTSCPDPIIGETLDGVITEWNPAAVRLYGYSAEEAIGQLLTILTPPDRLDEVAGFLQRVRQGEVIESVETVRRAKDGRLIDVALTLFPVRDDAGQIVAASAITRDISAYKQLEKALRSSEQQFRALVEHLPAAVYLVAANENEAPLYFSPYIETMVGVTPEEALQRGSGVHWLDYVHPDDRDRIAALNARTSEAAGRFRAEYRTIRNDGAYTWVLDDSVPIFDDDGTVVAWQGVMLDINDRKQAEEAQARLASIVEGADDAIVSLTLDGVITSWNHGAEQLYGYCADEMIGRSFEVLLPEQDISEALARFRQLGERPLRFEAKRRRSDGVLIDVAISLSPIRGPGGEVIGVSSITRDITARKEAEENLRQTLAEARAATNAKSRFLAMLSHELRTPLQAVLGYADFLLNSPGQPLTTEQREDVGYIHQGATRMVTLIDQMLDLSRMEAGRLRLHIADVDLAEVIEQVRQDVAPQAEAKGLSVTVSVPPLLPPVQADPDRLRQVLVNLAGNAVKFTEEGGIRISASPAGGGVDVAVSDTGIGIPDDALRRIFEEFQQVDSAQARQHGGAGLGLSIARGLAALMGGEITVTSQPGVGSTFTVHLSSAEDGRRVTGAPVTAGAFALTP